MKVYAIYKGDKFIDVGTAKELADRRGISVQTVWWMATKECHRRVEGTDRALAISFTDDEGGNKKMTEKFRIKQPWKTEYGEPKFGQNYYGVFKKTREIAICGEDAAPSVLKQYDFWFDEESAKEHGLQDLPRNYRNDEADE